MSHRPPTVGDKVKLTKDIWDEDSDNAYPPGYIALRGEVVIVRGVQAGCIYVSHEHITDNSFLLKDDEYEHAT